MELALPTLSKTWSEIMLYGDFIEATALMIANQWIGKRSATCEQYVSTVKYIPNDGKRLILGVLRILYAYVYVILIEYVADKSVL